MKSRGAGSPTPPPAPSTDRLKLELDIHREELATQNEDLRRTNALLVAAKDRYAQLYDGAPTAYFTVAADGVIVEANVAGAALLGVPRRFLFGRTFDELVVASSRESFRRFRGRVLEVEGRLVHANVLVTDRRRIPVRIEASRLSGPAFSADECILCVTDESERHELESQRRQIESRVAETQRVESLGTLAAGVARDVNDILSIVQAYSELLLTEDGVPPATLGHARAIREAMNRAAVLSQQMLVYAGESPFQPEHLDLSRVVRATADVLNQLVPDERLRLELADGLSAVNGDAAHIGQIVLNLVANAAEAIAPGGSVVVRTRGDADGRVVLEVADDGRGMDEATQRRAFNPFFSTKFAGRGLGLAVVHGHARSHGARVSVASRPHHGATFTVAFPAATPAVRAANDNIRRAASPDGGLVLVIDGDEGSRAAAGRLLERMGFAVCAARNGIEALALVRDPPRPLVAIVLDLTTPRLGGQTTLVELRDRISLPVLLVSAHGKDQIAADLLALADGFLAKPFTAASLERELESAFTLARDRQPA